MKTSTIKQVLRKKIDAWIDTIQDVEIARYAKDNTIVTGGSIASMLLKEDVNDFDVYFRTKEAAKAIAKYYVKLFVASNPKVTRAIVVEDVDERIRVVVRSAGIASSEKPEEPLAALASDDTNIDDPGNIEDTYVEIEAKALKVQDAKEFKPIFLSSNAITLSNKVQLVFRFFGQPDELHTNYDFVHCTNYWTSWNSDLVLRPAALEALLTKELRYVGSKYPIASVLRLRKFIGRGWTINAGQILKMAMQISELDLTDHNVLKDQLTGVDCAYFAGLLNTLKTQDSKTISSSYLIEIADKLF
jgi:hypothetical protein